MSTPPARPSDSAVRHSQLFIAKKRYQSIPVEANLKPSEQNPIIGAHPFQFSDPPVRSDQAATQVPITLSKPVSVVTMPKTCDQPRIPFDPIKAPSRSQHLEEVSRLKTQLLLQKESYDTLVVDVNDRNGSLVHENRWLKEQLQASEDRIAELQKIREAAEKSQQNSEASVKQYQMMNQGLSAELGITLDREAAQAELIAAATKKLEEAEMTIGMQGGAIFKINQESDGVVELKTALAEAKKSQAAAEAMMTGQESRIKAYQKEIEELEASKKLLRENEKQILLKVAAAARVQSDLESRLYQGQGDSIQVQMLRQEIGDLQRELDRRDSNAASQQASIDSQRKESPAAKEALSKQLQVYKAENENLKAWNLQLTEKIEEGVKTIKTLRKTIVRLGKAKITEDEAAKLKWYQKLLEKKEDFRKALEKHMEIAEARSLQLDRYIADKRELEKKVAESEERLTEAEGKVAKLEGVVRSQVTEIKLLQDNDRECQRMLHTRDAAMACLQDGFENVKEEMRLERAVAEKLRHSLTQANESTERLETDLGAAKAGCYQKASSVNGKIYDPDGLVCQLSLEVDDLKQQLNRYQLKEKRQADKKNQEQDPRSLLYLVICLQEKLMSGVSEESK